jgi:hypothetical protein
LVHLKTNKELIFRNTNSPQPFQREGYYILRSFINRLYICFHLVKCFTMVYNYVIRDNLTREVSEGKLYKSQALESM